MNSGKPDGKRLDIQYEKILARFSVGWKTKSAGLHDGGGSWALIEDRVEKAMDGRLASYTARATFFAMRFPLS